MRPFTTKRQVTMAHDFASVQRDDGMPGGAGTKKRSGAASATFQPQFRGPFQ